MDQNLKKRTRAQESRAAIERLYIIMRHLIIRGSYKPMGVSGSSIIKSLLTLNPEIYGAMADDEKMEIDGLLYVIERLPKGIEACRQINLISREGFENSGFEAIIPLKRRRNCYKVGSDQMYIEITLGRSDIYDILSHLTFLYIEAEKVKRHALDNKGRKTLAWQKLEAIIESGEELKGNNREEGFAHLSFLMGRTFKEIEYGYDKLMNSPGKFSLFTIVYWMGRLAMEEAMETKDREITFSSTLRERIGHHTYGDLWATKIKKYLHENGLIDRPIHIISANLHSIVNTIYAWPALGKNTKDSSITALATFLRDKKNDSQRNKVLKFAADHGFMEIEDTAGTNITVQIIDTSKLPLSNLSPEIKLDTEAIVKTKPVLLVMDYAFGEQAYETMDELLKTYDLENGQSLALNVWSISIMGKAGILGGNKGDIMVPTAHVFEGTADNYPIDNDLSTSDFIESGIPVFAGPMISVLGTSLQNADVLNYFLKSSWRAIGLEMEGAHYQKAIQSASRIRKSITENVVLRYAYYASDNPLLTEFTLASGSLGSEGIRSTYCISLVIINKILGQRMN